MRGKQRSWKWLIATGLGVTAFLAWTALASGGLSEHSKSVTVTAAGDKTATASCPSGTEAVSGGFAARGFDPQFTGASVIPYGSRHAQDHQWTVDGHNFGMADGKLVSYVYCDRHEPNLAVVSQKTLVGGFTAGSAAAKCPQGSEAVSGGWRSPGKVTGDIAFYAFTSERASNRKWKVTAYNNDANNSHKLTVFAYCDKGQPGLVERSKSTKVAGGVATSLAPKCPKGLQAVSGGFESKELTPGQADAAFTFGSRRTSGATWRTAAYGNGKSTEKSPITAFAYCKK